MCCKSFFNILVFIVLTQSLFAQKETYTVTLAPFSSDKYDEFSPVIYKNGIVFCSNRNIDLKGYSTSQDKGFFKIYYIENSGKVNWQNARLLSKDLTAKLNNGPVTFNRSRDTIYFSRNLDVSGSLKEISSKRNKLGLFSSVFVEGEWTKIKELRFNSEWYNVTTPWLSPDGNRLFFASDKPGGFGGFDLYFSQWKSDYWEDPVNLGPIINTAGNESYPYINPSGELFFSSDGHPGMGKKDIFFSRFSGKDWLTPVRLDPPVNSEFDDFGIVTDTLISEGYFSSNRNKTIDIYHFKTNFPQIFYTNVQKENQYCFVFQDSGEISVDTLSLRYEWDFGDGTKASGEIVKHCFSGPGNYSIRLDIIDRLTRSLFFSKLSYNLSLRDFEQPYINSPDVSVKGETINFDGLKSNYPGYKVLYYSWDFGDGTRLLGESVKHGYNESGEFSVNLGLTLKSDTTGIIHKTGVTKKVAVYNDQQGRTSAIVRMAAERSEILKINDYSNAVISPVYSAESEIKKNAVFSIELFSSKERVSLNSSILKKMPRKFIVKEKFNEHEGVYSYVVDQQLSLMATYPAFKELYALGFKEARIKLYVLNNPSEKELHNLIRIYGAFAESYFDATDKLTSNAYIMLDQIVKLMNKYPSVRLEVAVHSDNLGPAENNLSITQKRSQILVNYLINRGINASRLIATGFGGSKPIAPNLLEKDRKLNRRIDFIIIN
jgi:outer membrane protein OmpA-like peptidoglycan-associated protein